MEDVTDRNLVAYVLVPLQDTGTAAAPDYDVPNKFTGKEPPDCFLQLYYRQPLSHPPPPASAASGAQNHILGAAAARITSDHASRLTCYCDPGELHSLTIEL